MTQRISVIGGGLFGCTAAVFAARAGHDVTLYEAKSALMCGATAGTYSRLHRGAHYPRSPETGRESRKAESAFRAEYGAAVIDGGRQFYIVPPAGSHVSPEQFAAFLDNEGLAFSHQDGIFHVAEPRVSLAGLQALVRQKVADAGIAVRLGVAAPPNLRRQYDRIVVAAYAGINPVLESLGLPPARYKFQVVEKPVALLPERFRDTSIVVVDGPFGCVDPLDDTPLHVLGHVVHTVHAQGAGVGFQVPAHLAPLIDQGLIRNCRHTRFRAVVDDLSRWIPGLGEAWYVGSSFCVRAVLADQEATDKRPTLVTRHDEQVVSVFSGKLGTACVAARQVLELIEEREAVAA